MRNAITSGNRNIVVSISRIWSVVTRLCSIATLELKRIRAKEITQMTTKGVSVRRLG